MTRGVAERVEELADRPEGYIRPNAPEVYTLLPLHELIASIYGIKSFTSKKAFELYNNLISHFKSEYDILIHISEEELYKVAEPSLVKLIMQNRKGELKLKPGYDGVYGELILE